MDQIEALYNLESPTRWFLNLEEKAKEQHYAGLHNAEIGDLDTHGFVGLLVHEDKMDVKIYLNWVPTMIGGDGVVEIAQYLALPGTPIKVSQHPYNASKWALYLTPGREIPHYLLVNAGVFKQQKIWVQIPGRRAKCFHCESTQHWSNQCSKKGQAAKPANPTAPTTKPASAPTKSYAVATSGKPAATSSPVRPPPPPTSTSPSTDRKRKTQEGKRTKKVEAEGKKEQKKAHNRTESPREAEREEVAEKENQEDDGFQMVARRRSRSSSPAKSSFKRQGSSGILMEQTRRKLLRSDLNRSFNQQF